MSVQIPLDLRPEPAFSFENFILSATNETAVAKLKTWPSGGFPVLLLSAPAGCGKTHLGHAWLSRRAASGQFKPGKSSLHSFLDRHVWLDDADEQEEAVLFSLINMALNGECLSLLLTAAKRPEEWPVELPDLRSRVSNIPEISVAPHDDQILEPVLRKIFDDMGRGVDAGLISYILNHCDRSIPALSGLAEKLDRAAREQKRDLTRAFTSSYLKRAGR